MEINFKDWLLVNEIVGPEVVDPYWLDDPDIGLPRNPRDPANRDKSEFYLLFALISSNKPSFQQAQGLMRFLAKEDPQHGGDGGSPFEKVRTMLDKGTLVRNIATSGMGTFNQIARSFAALVRYDIADLERLSPEELETSLRVIPKIGDKIVNFMKILHHDAPAAILDTNVLKSMRDLLVVMHHKHQTLPKKLTGGKSLKELAEELDATHIQPRSGIKGAAYQRWGAIWMAIMEKLKIKDIDAWRYRAMLRADPDWKWQPIVRGKVTPPIYTDDEGHDLINLSVNRPATDTRKGTSTPKFYKLSGEPYTKPPRVWGGVSQYEPFSPEGDPLVRKGSKHYHRDSQEQEYRPRATPEEIAAYKERWFKTFSRYRNLGFYDHMDDKGKKEYEAYLQYIRDNHGYAD